MPRLAVATPKQVEQIYRESYALWGAGLSRRDYLALWGDVSRTPWAAQYAGFYVWLDDRGEVLSSLKLYRPLVRLCGRTARSSVLGAVFTPRARRRRGHASALVRAVIERSRTAGDPLVLLFSDIGTEYYAGMGFHALPAEEQWGTLRGTEPASARGRLRPVREPDLPAIRRAHDAFCARRPLAVIRDEPHWEFLDTRSQSFFARLRNTDVIYRCRVLDDGDGPRGYLVTVEGRGEWNVREVGARDADPDVLAEIIRLGAAEAYRAGLRRFYGWLPRELSTRLGDWELHSRRRRGALPMLLPLGSAPDLRPLDVPGAAFIPYQDQF